MAHYPFGGVGTPVAPASYVWFVGYTELLNLVYLSKEWVPQEALDELLHVTAGVVWMVSMKHPSCPCFSDRVETHRLCSTCQHRSFPRAACNQRVN